LHALTPSASLADPSLLASAPESTPPNKDLFVWLPPLLLFLLASALAGWMFTRWCERERSAWGATIHDRNVHLCHGMWLEEDLRHGRLIAAVSDLDKCRVWPPLHDGLLVGTALFLGNDDERFGILPSLFGWIGAVVLSFLVARRAVGGDDRLAGLIAGLLAATLTIVSPEMRGFATDVMLESVGACLTLAVLYFHLRAVQNDRVADWRWFAIFLTALFLHKYNYWGLVVIALLIVSALRSPFTWARRTRTCVESIDWRACAHRELRNPINWLVGISLAALAFMALAQRTRFAFAGKGGELSLGPNFFWVVYLAIFLRLFLWYRSTGRQLLQQASPQLRQLVYWHVMPVAIWFLWPNRLYYFLWFSNPGTNVGEVPQHDLFGGYAYYWLCLTRDYHIATWSVLAVAGLLAVASWAWLRGWLRRGAPVVLVLVLFSFLLVCHHPNRKSRFLHSWIPAAWAAAGIGAGCLVSASRRGGALSMRSGAVALGTILLVGHASALLAPPPPAEGAETPGGLSVLDLTDSYLPYLEDSKKAAVFSNMPMPDLAQWTYMQRYRRAARLETAVKNLDPDAADNPKRFQNWLHAAGPDTIVCLDFSKQSVFFVPLVDSKKNSQYGELLQRQNLLRPFARLSFPQHGCVITVWKRYEGRDSDPVERLAGAEAGNAVLPHD
jgi:uncharacterized membrane protein YeaQ/YmgE (transglycosylase-associated protein family)